MDEKGKKKIVMRKKCNGKITADQFGFNTKISFNIQILKPCKTL